MVLYHSPVWHLPNITSCGERELPWPTWLDFVLTCSMNCPIHVEDSGKWDATDQNIEMPQQTKYENSIYGSCITFIQKDTTNLFQWKKSLGANLNQLSYTAKWLHAPTNGEGLGYSTLYTTRGRPRFLPHTMDKKILETRNRPMLCGDHHVFPHLPSQNICCISPTQKYKFTCPRQANLTPRPV